MNKFRFSRIPEISLCVSSFFLNFFWEVLQTYFYSMKDSAFNTRLYGWIHCTLGDVLLTLMSFWLVSIMRRNRTWPMSLNRLNFVVFIVAGVAGTVLSERVNVYSLKSWSYKESMPIIPWVDVGLTPLLQWIIIPPAVILLIRHHLLLHQELAEKH